MKVKLVNENFKSDYCINLLRSRGIKNVEDIINPTSKLLFDWKLLDNIENACEVFNSVLYEDKPFAIIVDSDCDGFCSSAIIYQYIKVLNPSKEIDFIIHTQKQHGLEDVYTQLQNIDYSLIICPDSATNDIQYVKEFTCPILILDHHIYDGVGIATNQIIVNNQMSQNYPNKALCGAGVTWQFIRAHNTLYYPNKIIYTKYTDLAALATIADMMDMRELENQYIVSEGLSNIYNLFFKTLLHKQSFSMGGKLNPISVAFYIVPLINAMVRVGSQEEKERMFLAFVDGERLVPCNKRGAKGTMEKVAIESARECTNAKSRQDKIKQSAVEELELKIFKHDLLENQILFIRLDDEDSFPPTLTGLVAAQLCTKYKKPTIVARSCEDGYIRGSMRNVANCQITSLKNFLQSSDCFEYVLGHDNAGGCSILNKNLEKLHSYANEQLASVDFGDSFYEVNFIRSAADEDLPDIIYDIENYRDIFGYMNSEPLINVNYINIKSNEIQILGTNKDTLKISKFGVSYMKFHAKDLINELLGMGDVQMNIVGRANVNEWGNIVTPQIFIDNYEIIDLKTAF